MIETHQVVHWNKQDEVVLHKIIFQFKKLRVAGTVRKQERHDAEQIKQTKKQTHKECLNHVKASEDEGCEMKQTYAPQIQVPMMINTTPL